MAITPKLDVFDLKMTTATRTSEFLLGKSQQHSLTAGQRHHRPDLISVSAGFRDGGNMFLAPGGLIEPMIMHVSLVTRAHMLQKPQDKLRGGKRKSLILPVPVVPIRDCHFPSIISDNPFLGKRWTPSVSATVRRSLPPTSVPGHNIDNKASRILPIESPDAPLPAPIPPERLPQQFEQKVLPQSSVLLRWKQMYRLPYAVGAKAAFGTKHVNMHMEAQITPVGVNRRHHTRNGRMCPASYAYRSQNSLCSGPSNYQEKLAISKQNRPELRRHRKRQMPVHHVEQSPLSICGSFLRAGYSTSWAESALATETNSVHTAAVITLVLHKAVVFRSAGKSLADCNFGCLGNSSGQTFIDQSLGLFPMIGKNSKKKTSSAHDNILSHGGFLRKSGLFFLGMN